MSGGLLHCHQGDSMKLLIDIAHCAAIVAVAFAIYAVIRRKK
jgi:hypothetical protein